MHILFIAVEQIYKVLNCTVSCTVVITLQFLILQTNTVDVIQLNSRCDHRSLKNIYRNCEVQFKTIEIYISLTKVNPSPILYKPSIYKWEE